MTLSCLVTHYLNYLVPIFSKTRGWRKFVANTNMSSKIEHFTLVTHINAGSTHKPCNLTHIHLCAYNRQ